MGDFAEEVLENIKSRMIASSTEGAKLEQDVKLDLLRYLSSTIDITSAKNNIENLVNKILETRLEEEIRNGGDISINTLIRLLEVLSKHKADMSGHILGVLKQQITIQQNNTLSLTKNTNNSITAPEEKKREISKNDFEKFKNVYEFIEKAKQIEMPNNDIQDAEVTENGE